MLISETQNDRIEEWPEDIGDIMVQTSFEEVNQIQNSGDYKLIPVTREIMADIRTPIQVLRALQNVSDHCFLLESVEDTRQWGRYTFLGYNPTMEISCKDHVLRVTQNGTTEEFEVRHPGDYIKKVVKEHKSPRIEGLPTFTSGLVGYFAYDYMQYGEEALKFKKTSDDFADCDLMLFDELICFDNYHQKIVLIENIAVADSEAALRANYDAATAKLDALQELVVHGEMKAHEGGKLLEDLTPELSEDEFVEKIEKIKHHIHEGDIFQLVFSNPMKAKFEGSLLDTYRVLRTTNPSPYMFYFSGDMEFTGASPETLVKVENRVVRTFPLAGTRPRGKSKEEDDALEAGLLKDEKERAEHNMLVDLGRNDLGRLSEFGSVKVDRYMDVLKYSHVMHIGSEVEGTLKDGVEAIDAIDTVLPAGTLSGAPKIRACQIIDELESDRRGIYGGAVGYVDFTGNLDVCIGIRMAYQKDGMVYVRSGAGIVADSNPKSEYQECINKAAAVKEAILTAEREIQN